MAPRRDYFDGCAAAHALDLVGERWALLVVRQLMLGPKRFTDLRTGLPHASPNVLSQRLRELEENGVLRRRRLPPPAASAVYELTDWGRELEPVLQSLGRWAARSLAAHPPSDDVHMGVDPFVLSLRTMFHGERAAGLDLTVQLHLSDQPFRLHVAGGEMTLEQGEVRAPDAVVRAAPDVLAGVVYMGQPLAEAEADGVVEISGDRAGVETLFACFPMPEPVPAAS